MRSLCRLSVCLYVGPTLIIFDPNGKFQEIQQGGHVIEDDLDAILYNPLPLTTQNDKLSNF
jgi:hypothetical protein